MLLWVQFRKYGRGYFILACSSSLRRGSCTSVLFIESILFKWLSSVCYNSKLVGDQIVGFTILKAHSYIVTLYIKEQKAEKWKQAAKHGIATTVNWCGYQILYVCHLDVRSSQLTSSIYFHQTSQVQVHLKHKHTHT